MEEKLEKAVIRLNYNELKAEAYRKGLKTDKEIANAIGVSPIQVWRASLDSDNGNYLKPGPAFIAGVLKTFGEPFERFFFLE